MDIDTRKIAIACSIGGVLCSAVALMFTPDYWWFGLIAGMAGGYISHEFREVRKAIPVALRSARRGSVYAYDELIAIAKEWLSRPHPFFYPAAIVVTPFYFFWGAFYFVPDFMKSIESDGMTTFLLVIVIVGVTAFIEMTLAVMFTVAILAFIGARVGERCYWWPFFMPTNNIEKDAKELEARGLRREPINYPNLARWFVKGLGLTIFFFIWPLWKNLGILVWVGLRFAWHLFRLIHSEKRVLCAIDGTLGGAVSYIWFASANMSFSEQMVLVIFGGLLGATFGVANWEIVSKRILRVHVPKNT